MSPTFETPLSHPFCVQTGITHWNARLVYTWWCWYKLVSIARLMAIYG